MAGTTFGALLEGHAAAFLARAVAWVDKDTPWAAIAEAARNDSGPSAARSAGAWVGEDIVAQGRPQGSAQAADLRQRASLAERTVTEALAGLSALGASGNLSPAAADARESLLEAMGGEADAIIEALQQGFPRGAGAPLVALRRPLTLADLAPEGARGERVGFARAVGPPPGLALEPIAQLRQDVARLKHYALREALGRGGRALSLPASSTYFKVIRPPVSLDGDLSEFRALSGVANAADAWADEVRAALLAGFLDRLKVREAPALAGAPSDVPPLLRALEVERAGADLKGALAADPESAVIPAEGLLALIIAAPLPAGGLTP
ncbi:MAG TPA: hypothetical protein VJ547_00160 [Candidatus Thermoplasmatota archaeon]|nr:hypothetical protein [Candidatus Thermoplasmatota archaeon]